VIVVVILSPTVMMIFIYVLWRIRQRQRRKQDIAPQQVVGNLATKIYFESKRQGNEPQECAICLEDYVDEDELRILPCKHEFHIICIDSWLTTRKKFVRIILMNVIIIQRIKIWNKFFNYFFLLIVPHL
jgi:E3 ubiquitin-protein ligase RNF13